MVQFSCRASLVSDQDSPRSSSATTSAESNAVSTPDTANPSATAASGTAARSAMTTTARGRFWAWPILAAQAIRPARKRAGAPSAISAPES
jgi:hypothetical protein